MFTIFASFLPKVVACCAGKLAVGAVIGPSRLDYVTDVLAKSFNHVHIEERLLEANWRYGIHQTIPKAVSS